MSDLKSFKFSLWDKGTVVLDAMLNEPVMDAQKHLQDMIDLQARMYAAHENNRLMDEAERLVLMGFHLRDLTIYNQDGNRFVGPKNLYESNENEQQQTPNS